MSAAAASGVRFAPNEFRYNIRAAAALVPSLIVAAALGGRIVMAVLTVGAMVWYLLDAMALREGSLTVVRPRTACQDHAPAVPSAAAGRPRRAAEARLSSPLQLALRPARPRQRCHALPCAAAAHVGGGARRL
jgi:hypothetical protein